VVIDDDMGWLLHENDVLETPNLGQCGGLVKANVGDTLESMDMAANAPAATREPLHLLAWE